MTRNLKVKFKDTKESQETPTTVLHVNVLETTELKEGIYTIPDNLRMYLEPGCKMLVVKKRVDRHIPQGDYRCKDCIHRIKGKMLPSKDYWIHKMDDVCEKRVKAVIGETTYYYGAPYNKKRCEMFGLRVK